VAHDESEYAYAIEQAADRFEQTERIWDAFVQQLEAEHRP